VDIGLAQLVAYRQRWAGDTRVTVSVNVDVKRDANVMDVNVVEVAFVQCLDEEREEAFGPCSDEMVVVHDAFDENGDEVNDVKRAVVGLLDKVIELQLVVWLLATAGAYCEEEDSPLAVVAVDVEVIAVDEYENVDWVDAENEDCVHLVESSVDCTELGVFPPAFG